MGLGGASQLRRGTACSSLNWLLLLSKVGSHVRVQLRRPEQYLRWLKSPGCPLAFERHVGSVTSRRRAICVRHEVYHGLCLAIFDHQPHHNQLIVADHEFDVAPFAEEFETFAVDLRLLSLNVRQERRVDRSQPPVSTESRCAAHDISCARPKVKCWRSAKFRRMRAS